MIVFGKGEDLLPHVTPLNSKVIMEIQTTKWGEPDEIYVYSRKY